MAHPQIEEWLKASSASFKAGIHLHDTFARSEERVSKALLKADTTFSRKKLRQSLERIALRQNKTPKTKEKPTRTKRAHKHGQTQGYPQHLVEIDRKLPLINSQINALANTTLQYDEGDALKEIALKILSMQAVKRRMWEELDYYAAHGVVMPGTGPSNQESDAISQLVDWLDRQPALLDYVRRYKKTSDPKKKNEVARRQKELEEIRAFIKAHQKC